MIKSEDFIFVQGQLSPESKNIFSNTDDQLIIQVYIIYDFQPAQAFCEHINIFFKTKNKSCRQNNFLK